MLLEAVKRGGYMINRIHKPSEELQIAAIFKEYHSIRYIDNPSEIVQLMAVKKDPHAIALIHNPCGAVISYVIENTNDLGIIQSMRIDFDKLADDLKLLLEIK